MGKKAKIVAAEIVFERKVSLKKLPKLARKMYKKPDKYADVTRTGASAYYHFLKYLWIEFPDGTEIRLIDYVENLTKICAYCEDDITTGPSIKEGNEQYHLQCLAQLRSGDTK